MEDTNSKNDLHTLISIDEFKALMGFDDRDDKLCRFCLVTSTLTIEEYCKRKFLRKQYKETFQLNGGLSVILSEYPVSEIVSVSSEQLAMRSETLIDPQFYCPMIGNDFNLEIPFELWLSPSLKPYNLAVVKVIYYGGYAHDKIPADLQAACMELAAWNFNRYKSKRIGMTGNIRGSGVQGEHFEISIPENVKALIEPYRRKLI